MKHRHPLHCLALAAAVTALAAPAPAQPTEAPFIVGVCSHDLHLRDTTSKGVQLLQQAGIESVRTDAHWAFLERKRDQLKVERHWPAYLAGNEAQGIESMFILGYGNRFHGNGEKPRSEPVRAAFNRYVAFTAQQFRGRIKHYEIWNEWDVEDPIDPQFTQDYARLITDAAGIIRQHDPDAKVLAGAVTTKGIESGFALRLVEAGIMQSIDGLSLHPYVHCRNRGKNTPEAWIEWLAEVDLELSSAANQPVPLYLTEMAWPAHQGACGIDETLQAAYLARSFFLAKTLPNVRGYWWYDFRNDGTDKREREHNFGLVRQDYSLKPAYRVLETISPIINNFEFVGRVGNSPDSVQLQFSNGQEQLLVAWAPDRPRPATITATGKTTGDLKLLDTAQPDKGWSSFKAWQCASDAGTCTAQIELDRFPKIVSLGEAASPDTGQALTISTR
ncbi:hypothetical protein [Stutzerimonas xanthomarina]|jgi:hypothetical protein|uniref:hypothetical protein n=1 Tax=Stutzerimonas xanthomarina TaxID=271420 RepID=UPI0029B98EFF|nr:hypothetical protein [Stutzerimonas xanthomarina]MDX2352613.1 hypothetical protein [Stutzerimonas xanthomarina]